MCRAYKEDSLFLLDLAMWLSALIPNEISGGCAVGHWHPKREANPRLMLDRRRTDSLVVC